jgi:DNA-binding MarR family transcriptional regulator
VNPSLSFGELKQLLELSDGNLSVHARKLEDANLIQCKKSIANRMSRTVYRITRSGRVALEDYLNDMEELIRSIRGKK